MFKKKLFLLRHLHVAILFLLISVFLFFTFYKHVVAAGDLVIYDDAISVGWNDWSWGTSTNFQNPAPVYSGNKSIWTVINAWGAIYLHTDQQIDTANYQNLTFAVQPTVTGQKFQILIYDSNNQIVKTIPIANYGGDPVSGSFKVYQIPTTDFGTRFIKGVALQDASGQTQQPVFVDNIRLVAATPLPTINPTPNPTVVPTPFTTPNPTAAPVPSAVSTANIYQDNLSSGFMNWSWGSNVDFANNNSYSGTNAIAFTPYSAWAGLYLHNDTGIDTTPFSYLTFAAEATASGEKFAVALYDNFNQPLTSFIPLGNLGGDLVSGQWKVYTIPLASLNGVGKTVKGIAVQDALGQVQPTVYFDNMMFVGANVLPSTAPIATPAPLQSVGYVTFGNKIYKRGAVINLKGINWFGFETGTHVVHGLWMRNYKDMILQMKSLGFNAVRVPFCPATLMGTGVTSVDYSKNPDLNGLNSLQALDKILTEINNSGMYFILDHHSPDCNVISELWYTQSYPENVWINDLKFAAARYKNLPYFVGIDLKNEPHGTATWGTGNYYTDWNLAAQRAGQAVLATNPNLLVFVEGIGESKNCSGSTGHFWGENLEPQKCAPIDPSTIPANKLVLSPHVYGPDVSYESYFSDPNFPNNMPSVWDTQFGYLASNGFTLVPGEWGGKMGTNGGNSGDLVLQQAWTNYMKNKQICSSFYWDFNPNSFDTGGVLQDDWTTPWQVKMNVLNNYFTGCN